MKRDMNLIRLILLDVEGEEEVDLSSYTEEQIGYHRWLLINAGLAEGTDDIGYEDLHPNAFITWLNWEGHDFLDAARDEDIWNTAQQTISEKVGTVAFDVFKALLIALGKDQVGLA